VVGAVTGGAEVDAVAVAADGATDVTWARESWVLEKDRLLIERQVLRPSASGTGHVACEVSVRVQAAWTGAVLTVPYGATSRARADGEEPMSCQVSAAPGEWRIVKLA